MNSMDYLGERAEEILSSTFAPIERIMDTKGEVRILTEVRVSEDGFVQVGDKTTNDRRLTGKERQILLAIMRRKGVCSKEFLLQELYAGMDEPELKIIDVFTCKLRKKLGAHSGMIDTVWGRGYVRADGYKLIEPRAYLGIDPDLRRRIDELALAQGCKADEMAAALLLKAVIAKEKETWA